MSKLDSLNWSTITRAEARRLVPVANRRERAAADLVNATGADDLQAADAAEAAFVCAMALAENLTVYALAGVKVADPFKLYHDWT